MTNACMLYVEDEEEDVLLLQFAFKRAGVSNLLQAVADGHLAIDYLAGKGTFADRSSYPLPCLVLLDIKLPGMSGLDVLEWIRHDPRLKSMVVIIFTSSPQLADVDRAYRSGANAYVLKPVDNLQRQEFAVFFKNWWLCYNQFPTIRED